MPRKVIRPCDRCRDPKTFGHFSVVFDRFLCEPCLDWAMKQTSPAEAVRQMDAGDHLKDLSGGWEY